MAAAQAQQPQVPKLCRLALAYDDDSSRAEALLQQAQTAVAEGARVFLDLGGCMLTAEYDAAALAALSKLLGTCGSLVKLVNGSLDLGPSGVDLRGSCWMEGLVLMCRHERPASLQGDGSAQGPPMLTLHEGAKLDLSRCSLEQQESGETSTSDLPAVGVLQHAGSALTARHTTFSCLGTWVSSACERSKAEAQDCSFVRHGCMPLPPAGILAGAGARVLLRKCHMDVQVQGLAQHAQQGVVTATGVGTEALVEDTAVRVRAQAPVLLAQGPQGPSGAGDAAGAGAAEGAGAAGGTSTSTSSVGEARGPRLSVFAATSGATANLKGCKVNVQWQAIPTDTDVSAALDSALAALHTAGQGSSLTAQHMQLTGAGALAAGPGAGLQLLNCQLDQAHMHGVRALQGATLTMEGCSVANCFMGVKAEAARQAEQGTTKAALADCSVSSCCMGLVAFGKAELVLRQCNVEAEGVCVTSAQGASLSMEGGRLAGAGEESVCLSVSPPSTAIVNGVHLQASAEQGTCVQLATGSTVAMKACLLESFSPSSSSTGIRVKPASKTESSDSSSEPPVCLQLDACELRQLGQGLAVEAPAAQTCSLSSCALHSCGQLLSVQEGSGVRLQLKGCHAPGLEASQVAVAVEGGAGSATEALGREPGAVAAASP